MNSRESKRLKSTDRIYLPQCDAHCFSPPTRIVEHSILLYLQSISKKLGGCTIIPDSTLVEEITCRPMLSLHTGGLSTKEFADKLLNIEPDEMIEILSYMTTELVQESVYNMKPEQIQVILTLIRKHNQKYNEKDKDLIHSLDWTQVEYTKKQGVYIPHVTSSDVNSVDYFFDKFNQCLEREDTRYVLFSLGIKSKGGNGKHDSEHNSLNHANFCIYDKQYKTMERFDPHAGHLPKEQDNEITCLYLDSIDTDLHSLFETRMGKNFIQDYYSPIDLTQQAPTDEGDYRLVWSIMYAQLRLENPDIPRNHIVNKALKAIPTNYTNVAKCIRCYSNKLVLITEQLRFDNNKCPTLKHKVYMIEHMLYWKQDNVSVTRKTTLRHEREHDYIYKINKIVNIFTNTQSNKNDVLILWNDINNSEQIEIIRRLSADNLAILYNIVNSIKDKQTIIDIIPRFFKYEVVNHVLTANTTNITN
jgi:hypothetical protein